MAQSGTGAQAETAASLARDWASKDVEMMATGDSMEQAMLEMAESPMEEVNGGGLRESEHARRSPREARRSPT